VGGSGGKKCKKKSVKDRKTGENVELHVELL